MAVMSFSEPHRYRCNIELIRTEKKHTGNKRWGQYVCGLLACAGMPARKQPVLAAQDNWLPAKP